MRSWRYAKAREENVAQKVKNAPKAVAAPRAEDRATRALAWLQSNQRNLMGVAIVLAVAALGVWFAIAAKQRREAFAARSLSSARAAIQSGNLPLAASDLSRLIQTRGGTVAADEATILLAQIRLMEGDPERAASELEAAISGGLRTQFRAPAHGLLGGALEQLGRLSEAGASYERAANAAWYDFLAAQYLNDAGRAHAAAGDTATAAQVYERLLTSHPEAPAATEARVRLAELRPTQPTAGT